MPIKGQEYLLIKIETGDTDFQKTFQFLITTKISQLMYYVKNPNDMIFLFFNLKRKRMLGKSLNENSSKQKLSNKMLTKPLLINFQIKDRFNLLFYLLHWIHFLFH